MSTGDCFGETFFIGFAGFKNKAATIEELIAKRELSVLPLLAPSETTSKIRRARDLNAEIPTRHAADILGNGIRISCPDTVPFCLFAAGEFLDDYEKALWQTVSALGDRDTTCAIVGGIVVMYNGTDSIPQIWKEKREAIPTWV